MAEGVTAALAASLIMAEAACPCGWDGFRAGTRDTTPAVLRDELMGALMAHAARAHPDGVDGAALVSTRSIDAVTFTV